MYPGNGYAAPGVVYNPYAPQSATSTPYPQPNGVSVPYNAQPMMQNAGNFSSVPPPGYAAYPPSSVNAQQPMVYSGLPGVAPPMQQPTGVPPPATGNSANPLSDLFVSLDRDGNGRIDNAELKEGLSRCGVQFNQDTATRIVKMFDATGDIHLEFREFISAYEWILQMHKVFVQIDTSRNGLLDGQEVRQALANSGYTFTDDVFQLLMKKADRERRMQLTFSGYLDLCIYVGYAKNVFGFYDRARTGQVTFNFERFLAASLSTQL